MLRRVRLLSMAVLIGTLIFPAPSEAQSTSRIDVIKQRGTLIVGVKADYPPWGMVDADGTLVGMEPDLARDIAGRLGVDLRLVSVSSASRLQKVEDGTVDLIIATMGDTVKRRKVSGLIEPNYYASGVNILMSKALAVNSWAELKGRTICLTDGAYYNRTLVERYLIKPVIFKGTRDTQLALEAKQCAGWVYDDSVLGIKLQGDEGRWADFAMPLPTILVSPWAMAVQLAERDGPWGKMVAQTIAEWHQSGFLIEKEAAWNLPPSTYLAEQRVLWNRKDTTNRYVCRVNTAGRYPVECLDQTLAAASGRSAEVYGQGIANFLYQNGIDFPPLYDEFSLVLLLKGLGMTLALSLIAIVGSLVIGITVGTLKVNMPKYLGMIIDAVNAVFYMTPPILNLYVVLFGLGGWMAATYGVSFNTFVVACVVLSLYAGSSNAVIIANVICMVRKEVGADKGLREIFPAVIGLSFGGLTANSVNIVKAVGIASTIAVSEIIFAASSIISEYGNAAVMMNFLMVFYLVLVAALYQLLTKANTWVTKWAHKKT